jgi:chitodextrinase
MEVNLACDAVSDPAVVGHGVYRDGSLIGTSTVPSFSDTGLSPDATHSYTVDAYDSQGNVSAESTSVTATTPADATPPTAPTGLSGTAVGAREADLSWQPASDDVGVTGYDVTVTAPGSRALPTPATPTQACCKATRINTRWTPTMRPGTSVPQVRPWV